jgi:DNA-binding SARP family transcriptional activator/tetratricopeptide (TPR) repeat protein
VVFRRDIPLADPGVAPLHVYVMGPPRVEWLGQPLAVPRRQARALLFRLASSQRAVSRQALSFLFWPDIHEADARRHITRLLTHLRRALPVPEVLQAAGDRVGLDMLRAWSDVVEFDRLCAVQDSYHRFTALQQAVALYRGPFLAGLSLPSSPEFEAWSLQEQCARERLYLEALDLLIEHCTAQGAYHEAIAYAQRYLETDELAETTHRRLIELYALDGDRGAALRQFERCATILERELGVSPLPETRMAYQAVLQGSRAAPVPVPPPVWTTLPSLHAPLVGRDRPLSRLQRAADQARLGHGSVILIAGEPGIGKSRLLQEFVTGLRDQATVVSGSSHEPESSLPYWPLMEALRPHASAASLTALDIEPLYLAEVARLLPEVRTCLPDLSALSAAELGQNQGRLFLALARWLRSLAARRPPLILCLDDLHWADDATLSWLGYFARSIPMTPVLVIGTYRTEEAGAVSSLRTQLMRQGLLHEIVLKGLPLSEVVRLVRHLSDQAVGVTRFSQRLHRETGGNPFFLLETLRVMFEAGILWQDETGWSTGLYETTADYRELPLPETVCQAIRERVSRLSLQARQVLEAGAVIGQQFDLNVLRQTSGRGDEEVVDALEMLSARRLISEGARTYQFGHDLIRNIVYRDLSSGRRQLLHRRAAAALLGSRSNDVGALAWHFEQAGDLAHAADYALRAGERARDVFAHIEAHAYFDKALTLLESEAGHLREPREIAANWRLRVQALYGRGWAFRLLGDMDAFSRDSEEIARLAGLLGDQRELAHLHWREAHTYRWFCRYSQALMAAEEGIRLSRAIGEVSLEAICQRESGMAARARGDYARAQAALEKALALFVDLGNVEYEIHALGNLSTLWWRQGKYDRALDLARRALARCEEVGSPFDRRLALGDMGAAAAAMGDSDQARLWLEESLSIAQQIADRTQEIFCLGHLGWLYVQTQQPTQALEHLRDALALAEQIGSCTEQSWLHAGLAEVHRLVGDPSQAADHGRQAMRLAQAHGRAYDQELARLVWARLERRDA